MGAIVAVFCLAIFGSTSYMAATCTPTCPVMADVSGSVDSTSLYSVPAIVDAPQPTVVKTTPMDYYVTPKP